jgi:hypothetical protein
MKCDHAAALNDTGFQMIPPLFQPLRLWTPREHPDCGRVNRPVKPRPAGMPLHAFTIKGGFVNMADGERRMVIAGRMFKHRER